MNRLRICSLKLFSISCRFLTKLTSTSNSSPSFSFVLILISIIIIGAKWIDRFQIRWKMYDQESNYLLFPNLPSILSFSHTTNVNFKIYIDRCGCAWLTCSWSIGEYTHNNLRPVAEERGRRSRRDWQAMHVGKGCPLVCSFGAFPPWLIFCTHCVRRRRYLASLNTHLVETPD